MNNLTDEERDHILRILKSKEKAVAKTHGPEMVFCIPDGSTKTISLAEVILNIEDRTIMGDIWAYRLHQALRNRRLPATSKDKSITAILQT